MVKKKKKKKKRKKEKRYKQDPQVVSPPLGPNSFMTDGGEAETFLWSDESSI